MRDFVFELVYWENLIGIILFVILLAGWILFKLFNSPSQ